MVRIAILGFGTVGSGVYEIIKENSFDEKALNPISVKYILDIRDFPEHPEKEIFTKDLKNFYMLVIKIVLSLRYHQKKLI